MFSSVLSRRVFTSVFFSISGCYLVICLFTVPLIRDMAYSDKEAEARSLLNTVCEILTYRYAEEKAFLEYAVNIHKGRVRDHVLLREKILKNRHRDSGSEEKARTAALEAIRDISFSADDSFWISDYQGNILIPPASGFTGDNFSERKDASGKRILPTLIREALDHTENYVRYRFIPPGGSRPLEEIAYVRNFPIWNWVIGATFSPDEAIGDVRKYKDAFLGNLPAELDRFRFCRTGYVFIFDEKLKMISHPDPAIRNSRFADLRNPDTGNRLGDDLIASVRNFSGEYHYRWDTPGVHDYSRNDRIAWIRQFRKNDTTWYVVLTVYAEDMGRNITDLKNRFLAFSGLVFVLLLFFLTFSLGLTLRPLRILASMSGEFMRRGRVAQLSYLADKGEIGLLGAAFYSLFRRIDSQNEIISYTVREQERMAAERDKARERAYHLGLINKKLQQEAGSCRDMHIELQKSEERYRAMLENIEEYFYEVDLFGNLMFFNDALYKMLGYEKDELVGMNFREYMDQKMSEKAFRAFRRAYRKNEPIKGFDWYLIKRDGSRCHVEVSASAIRDAKGEIVGFRGIARNVSDLIYLVYHDSLTGLYNRKAYFERLRETLSFARRDNREKNIFYLDLNKFKKVNDDYGHDIGDEILREVSRRLKNSLRETDYVCRLGGDEFTVILNNPGEALPDVVAGRIMASLSAPYPVGLYTIDFITPSIGISSYPEDAQDADDLTKCADKAMYFAKRNGRGFCFYHELPEDAEEPPVSENEE